MNAKLRLAAYAALLALLFGGGAGLGAATGPDPPPTPRATTVDHDVPTETPMHEGDH